MADDRISPTAAAPLLDLSVRHIHRLIQKGVLRQAADGTLSQNDATTSYIRHLKEGQRNQTPEARRLQRAKARSLEIDIAVKQG